MTTPHDVLGFTGTRYPLSAVQQVGLGLHLNLLLATFGGVVTGACVNLDAIVGRLAIIAAPEKQHTVIVPADRSDVDLWWEAPGWSPAVLRNLTVIWMPDGTTYKDRNQEIVNRSTRLAAYPIGAEDDPRQRRSGTWQTVRMARRVHRKAPIIRRIQDL